MTGEKNGSLLKDEYDAEKVNMKYFGRRRCNNRCRGKLWATADASGGNTKK